MSNNLNYNPDVLTCLANLSNDEVFTPPEIVNQMLDLLPIDLWQNKDAKFLDPVTKSGVFLREIAKRLNIGLAEQIPNQQTRLNHIFKNQLYGISITELTGFLARRSVYCCKKANSPLSICTDFDNEQGNIVFKRIEHTWQGGKCTYCGASQATYDRDDALETHAYQFIHTDNLLDIFGVDMKFDVIIGNPPYQLDTGGSGRQAKPIYQFFVEQAKKLNPHFLVMIIPARWYSGGFGLDDFRKNMLNDRRITILSDYENASYVFPGVDIAGGVCYFLWNRDANDDCTVISNRDKKTIKSKRPLNEFKIFIRDAMSVSILRKIMKSQDYSNGNLSEKVSPIQPFGLPTNYSPKSTGIPCWFIQKIGLRYASLNDVDDKNNYINKWKILIPKAPIAGQTDLSKPIRIYHHKNALISKPGECCTESYIIAGAFDSQNEAINFRSYLFTKVVRFLILQTIISQDVNRKNFLFVPDIGNYSTCFKDEDIVQRWGITKDEWEYIDSRIIAIDDIIGTES